MHTDELPERAEAIAAVYDVEGSTDSAAGEDASSIVEYAEENDGDPVWRGNDPPWPSTRSAAGTRSR